MSNEFKKFPSIDAYKHAIKAVRDYCKHRDLPIPTLTFTGTVKIHGTNACVSYNTKTEEFSYQSRERIVTPTSDNAGFASWAMSSDGKSTIMQVINSVKSYYRTLHGQDANMVYIYGEWAGKGVQPKVAVSELQKRFYIFRVEIDGITLDISELKTRHWVEDYPIFSIYDFPTYNVDIDFNAPELMQNKLIELAMAVEAECPVGKAFGVSGIGEGIVFRNEETGVQFKVKGEKHQNSKVRTLKEIAPIDIVQIEKLNELADYVLGENRLKQGIDKMREMGYDVSSNQTIGHYIKWICEDVFKEELDTIVNSGISTKKLGNKLAERARQYFVSKV